MRSGLRGSENTSPPAADCALTLVRPRGALECGPSTDGLPLSSSELARASPRSWARPASWPDRERQPPAAGRTPERPALATFSEGSPRKSVDTFRLESWRATAAFAPRLRSSADPAPAGSAVLPNAEPQTSKAEVCATQAELKDTPFRAPPRPSRLRRSGRFGWPRAARLEPAQPRGA
jgi:hypothetical protein